MILFVGQCISCNVVEMCCDDVVCIFNIQCYLLNDGEGICMVVFFKGCLYFCLWCVNSELIFGKIQMVCREVKCLYCVKCLCDVDECFFGVFEWIGCDISFDVLEWEVMKDDIFFCMFGGGVMFFGGEVLMQVEFVICFLQ